MIATYVHAERDYEVTFCASSNNEAEIDRELVGIVNANHFLPKGNWRLIELWDPDHDSKNVSVRK